MTRAHIADAAIVRKTREGREAEIRPCIGCNQGCVGMLLGPERRMGCTVNPYIGRAGEVSDDRLPPAAAKRTVLVIGGGPRSEEHTSELKSLMRSSYAVFCLKKKNRKKQ